MPEIIFALLCSVVLAKIIKIWVKNIPSWLVIFLFLSTPVVFVVARSNMPDSLLLLLTALAMYKLSQWATIGKIKDFVILNLLFLLIIFTKLGAIYLIAPSFIVAVFFFSDKKVKGKILYALFLLFNLLIAPLLWALLYQYLPGRVPFVGATGTGNPLTLAYYSEGFGRVLGVIPNFLHNLPVMPSAMAFPNYQHAGIWKLFKTPYIEQYGWFLPLTLLGIALMALQAKKTYSLNRKMFYFQIFNTLWFLGVFFGIGLAGSPACCTHPYYSVMLVIPQTFIICNFILNSPRVAWSFSFLILLIFQLILLHKIPYINYKHYLALLLLIFIFSFFFLFAKRISFRSASLIMLTFLPISMIFFTVNSYPLALRHGDPLAGSFAVLKEEHGLKQAYLDKSLNLSMVGESSSVAEGVEITLSDKLKSLPTHYWGAATLREYIAAPLQLTINRPVMAWGGELGAESPITLNEIKSLISNKKLCYFVVDSRDIFMLNKKNSLSPWSTQAYSIMEYILTSGQEIEYDNHRGPVILNLCSKNIK